MLVQELHLLFEGARKVVGGRSRRRGLNVGSCHFLIVSLLFLTTISSTTRGSTVCTSSWGVSSSQRSSSTLFVMTSWFVVYVFLSAVRAGRVQAMVIFIIIIIIISSSSSSTLLAMAHDWVVRGKILVAMGRGGVLSVTCGISIKMLLVAMRCGSNRLDLGALRLLTLTLYFSTTFLSGGSALARCCCCCCCCLPSVSSGWGCPSPSCCW
mmetsp:Transcript_12501/g.34134  ORF Transcript_12501/g.34134 Transcript_12501/m.34134 type:complete len:210 (-) Transcript_12501:509-1138(-)